MSRLATAFRGFAAGLAGKSFAAAAAAWARGDDLSEAPRSRLTCAYAQSGHAYAAVNLISGEFSGLALDFTAGDREYAEPALAAWFRAPILGPDRRPMARAIADRWLALWLLTEGEFFIFLDDTWLVPRFGAKFFGLTPGIIAAPDRVNLVFRGGELAGYEYTDPAGRRAVFLPEQVIHVMEPNPLDAWRGLGRSQVARVATEAAFLTGVYVRDLMRNNGDQGFIVVGKGGPATDEQRDQITAGLRAKRNALRLGIARDLFLTGDLTVERPPERAAGTDLAASQSASQQEVFLAYGVPPSMATVKQAYSIGKESDRYQLITATSQPVSRLVCGAYAELARRLTGVALDCAHDWEDHPVLQEVRNSRLESALKLWGAGMAWREVNAYLRLGMKPFAGWEIPYLPFSVSPALGSAPAPDPVADPALAEPDAAGGEDPEIKAVRLLLLTRARSARPVCRAAVAPDAFAAFQCAAHGEPGVAQRDRDPQQLAQWRTLMAKRRASLAAFKSAFTRVLMSARAETLRKLADAPRLSAGAAPVAKAAAVDFLFSLGEFATAVRDALGKQHRSALQIAGQQLLAELGLDDPFTSPPAEVTAYLAARQNKLRDVPQNVYDRIKGSLQAGLDAGESTADLTARVKGEFNTIADADARRIAITETAAAYGAGRDQAMRTAGVQFKQWLTSGNGNVRPYHVEANGQTVDISAPFIVGGEELMHPGDDAGTPGNTINCHCVSIAVAAPEDAA